MSEIAWIGSIIGIGGLIGTIVMGWFADQFGRKNSMLAMAIPQIVSTETRSPPPLYCADYKQYIFQHSTYFNQAAFVFLFYKYFQISFLLIIYAQNTYYLLISRLLTGFVGGAIFVIVPTMLAELAEDR